MFSHSRLVAQVINLGIFHIFCCHAHWISHQLPSCLLFKFLSHLFTSLCAQRPESSLYSVVIIVSSVVPSSILSSPVMSHASQRETSQCIPGRVRLPKMICVLPLPLGEVHSLTRPSGPSAQSPAPPGSL